MANESHFLSLEPEVRNLFMKKDVSVARLLAAKKVFNVPGHSTNNSNANNNININYRVNNNYEGNNNDNNKYSTPQNNFQNNFQNKSNEEYSSTPLKIIPYGYTADGNVRSILASSGQLVTDTR